MKAQVTPLRYWKEEYSEATCEDALECAVSRGLFAVADGVSKAIFSRRWAEALCSYYVAHPLVSVDRFETEWWLEGARSSFNSTIDESLLADQYVRIKAKEGSHSTLAAMRVCRTAPESADLEFIALGDSCIFVGDPSTRSLDSFPISNSAEFDRNPICFPTEIHYDTALFDRDFHRPQQRTYTVNAGQVVALTTDAVARWVLDRGKGRFQDPWEPFELLLQCSPESWPEFVRQHRLHGELNDDDATALVVHLVDDANPEGELLGAPGPIDVEIRRRRQAALMDAIREDDQQRIAIVVGDPACSGLETKHVDLERARRVADAMLDMVRALRAGDSEKIVRDWDSTYAGILEHEYSARLLRQSVAGHRARLGTSAPDLGQALPSAPATHVLEHVNDSTSVQSKPDDRAALEADSDPLIASADKDVPAVPDPGPMISKREYDGGERTHSNQQLQEEIAKGQVPVSAMESDGGEPTANIQPVLDHSSGVEMDPVAQKLAQRDKIREALRSLDEEACWTLLSDVREIQDCLDLLDLAEVERIAGVYADHAAYLIFKRKLLIAVENPAALPSYDQTLLEQYPLVSQQDRELFERLRHTGAGNGPFGMLRRILGQG